MFIMKGPAQQGRYVRWLGFLTRGDRDGAVAAVRSDPAMWDGIDAGCIIDLDLSKGRWEPVRGSDADCRRLALAARELE